MKNDGRFKDSHSNLGLNRIYKNDRRCCSHWCKPWNWIRGNSVIFKLITIINLHAHYFTFLQLTRQLAAKGKTVYATARSTSTVTDLIALSKSADVDVKICILDVSSPASISDFAAELKTRVNHVDLLINNAGIMDRSGLSEVTSEEMVRIFQTNAIGPLLVTQALQSLLGGKLGPSVVANMTSKMGSVGDNGMGGYYSVRFLN